MNKKIIIITGHSGAGKTTVVNYLLKSNLPINLSRSFTTRDMRVGEKDGDEYNFTSINEFKKRIDDNEFVEWNEVHDGVFYGTTKSELERIWSTGDSPLFTFDPSTAKVLEEKLGVDALSIFLKIEDRRDIEKRLHLRGDEKKEIEKRISKIKEELEYARFFDEIVINNDGYIEKTKERVLGLVKSFLNE